MSSMSALRPLTLKPGGGTGVATTTSAVDTAIPDDASGAQARTVLITVSEDTWVLPISAGGSVVAVGTGIIVTPESGGIVLNVSGYGDAAEISHLRVSAVGRINICPLEM